MISRAHIRSVNLLAAMTLLMASLIIRASGIEPTSNAPTDLAPAIRAYIADACLDCHSGEKAERELDLSVLPFPSNDAKSLEAWGRVHDRVARGEMPPPNAGQNAQAAASTLPENPLRVQFLKDLSQRLHEADRNDVERHGRGPIRRLTRREYEANLRDALDFPELDIRDLLPEDRESQGFRRVSRVLDLSRVQLSAYLEAAQSALRSAAASGVSPPAAVKFRAVGRDLFQETATFGEREAMFFAKDNRAIDLARLAAEPHHPDVELALFRSAHWPYYGYPRGFVAKRSGDYAVRFSARAIRQLRETKIEPATASVAMTFRARKPSGPDVSGDVRATGGWLDVRPERAEFQTTIRLREGETFEYSLLGLPVPLARNVDGGPPTYRYPPFPTDGQPGVAFQWLEVEGPISPATWPPASHRVLYGDLPLSPPGPNSTLPFSLVSDNPKQTAATLLSSFAKRVIRRPLISQELAPFIQLAQRQLDAQVPLADALLTSYTALLTSRHFLFLHEPRSRPTISAATATQLSVSPPDASAAGSASYSASDHYDIADRLSHFLVESRPDQQLLDSAAKQQLRNSATLRSEAQRLIASRGFERFVESFTDDWLQLKHLRRDEPDWKRYPEYRFDDYLVESMERETRAFVTKMIRDNLPAVSLIQTDFALVNDRLAKHYGLAPVEGSTIREVPVPSSSPYGGLMTQGAILKVTANGVSTSPVIRGAWVMDRLLGDPPPPPPAKVPAVEPDVRGATSIRELLERHASDESCRSCHARFDPVGLGLENFDILGGWQTRYRGLEVGDRVTGIDRAGHDFAYTLTTTINARGRLLDGRDFDDIHQLKKLLAADQRALARNLLRQWIVYGTGAPVRFSDRREIERILDDCRDNGYRVRDLLLGLVTNRIFLGRDAE
jgi:hypothetical protein